MKSLKSKFFFYLLLPIILISIGYFSITNFFTNKNFNQLFEAEAGVNTERLIGLVKDDLLNDDQVKLTDKIFQEKYSGLGVEYILVFNENNQIMASTFLGEASKDVSQLLQVTNPLPSTGSYYLTYRTAQVLNIDKQIFLGNHSIGLVRAGYNSENQKKQLLYTFYVYSFGGLFCLLLVVIIYFRFIKLVLAPIKELTSAALGFSLGHLKNRVKVTTNDEVGNLAKVFNEMVDGLTSAQERIENEKITIEAKKKELDKWQTSTVNRELKMVELKNEIKQFKSNKKDLK